jgi:hypothetical protein
MQAMIPDTLQGALILSAIDFFLSFVIISGIGFVLALFPLMNRVGKTRIASRPEVVHKKPVDLETEEHVAVIAAAVYATMAGAYRIVSIQPVRREGDWVTEGRVAHHLSHLPRH